MRYDSISYVCVETAAVRTPTGGTNSVCAWCLVLNEVGGEALLTATRAINRTRQTLNGWAVPWLVCTA